VHEDARRALLKTLALLLGAQPIDLTLAGLGARSGGVAELDHLVGSAPTTLLKGIHVNDLASDAGGLVAYVPSAEIVKLRKLWEGKEMCTGRIWGEEEARKDVELIEGAVISSNRGGCMQNITLPPSVMSVQRYPRSQRQQRQ